MKNSVLYSIIVLPIFIIFLVSISIFSVSRESMNSIKEISSEMIKTNFMNNHKEISFNDINTLHNAIMYDDAQITSVLQHELQNKLEVAYDIVDNLYQTNKHLLPIHEIRNKVLTQLSLLTFDIGHDGYFYIFNTHSNLLMTPKNQPYKTQKVAYNDHSTEINLLMTLKEGLKKEKFFFDTVTVDNEEYGEAGKLKQLGVFEYKPLSIIVGTGEYLSFIENQYKKLYLKKIASLNDKKNMNSLTVFTSTNEGVYNVLDDSKSISLELSSIINAVALGESGFFQYKENDRDKLSYFQYIKKWNWIIESGFYIDQIKNTLHRLNYNFQTKTGDIIRNGIAIILLIILITIVLSSIIMSYLKKLISNYTTEINDYVALIDKNVITSSTDLEGNITNVSDAFSKISGYSKEELLGKKHNIVRHEDMPQKVYEKMWKSITHDKTWRGEFKNKRKDGTCYWVDSTIYPIFKNNEKVGYTAIRQDITDKKRVEEISITDALTSLYNRRHFDDIFNRILNASKRTDEYFSFLLLDIDFFKQYNDTYGHVKGDEALIKLSICINDQLKRANDIAFRLGGEEFGVIFKAKNQEKALLFSENLRETIEDLHIEHKKNKASKYMTVSIGLVCDKANKLSSTKEIYHNADTLLYTAKLNGRNQVAYKFKKSAKTIK